MIREQQPANTPKTSPYLAIAPQTFRQLRILTVGDVQLDIDGRRLRVRGNPVPLPRKEFMILRQLMENAGRVITRRALLDNAWGPEWPETARHYLPVHIRRIRNKIENDAAKPTHIRTVRNVGYIFVLP